MCQPSLPPGGLPHQEFINAPWNAGLMIYDNINDLLSYYYGLIKLGLDAHIPKRTINKRKKDKPWMTGYIRYLLMLRNKMNGTLANLIFLVCSKYN